MYTNFTLETILATAFGRRINLQRGESDHFSKSMELLLSGFTDGQFEQFILFHSKFTVTVRIDYLAVLAVGALIQLEVGEMGIFNLFL